MTSKKRRTRKRLKFLVAPIVLAVLAISFLWLSFANPQTGGVLSSNPWTGFLGQIFGGTPVIEGNNPITITLPNGTQVQLSTIPTGTLSFKMALVANYTDNSQDLLYSQSDIPGLAIISVREVWGNHILESNRTYVSGNRTYDSFARVVRGYGALYT